MNLRIRLYPSFVKQANKCENRDELIVLVHKLTKKSAKLARELSQEPAKESIPLKTNNGTRNGLPGTFNKEDGLTKKVTRPKRLDETEKSLVDSPSRERDLSPSSTTSHLKGNTDLDKLGLSVWEQLHRYTPDITDPEQISRLAYYSKYQNIIKDVIDRFQILTASDGVTKNNEAGLKPVSYKVLSRLLNDLYTDEFLELEIIKCGLRCPAYVFSTARCSKERFNRYTKRFRESEAHRSGLTKKATRPKESHEQKVNKVLAHNEAVKKGTIELKEQEEKEFVEYSKKRRAESQPKKEVTQTKIYDPCKDESFIKLVKETPDKRLQFDLKNNPMFKKHYDMLLEGGKI